MQIVRFQSKVEQTAEHLRVEMQRGRWGALMPGRNQLAKDLGINSKTVEEALRLLERENLLIPQGAGRRRRIVIPEGAKPPSLRVAVLYYDAEARGESDMVNLLHLLADAGHAPFSARKSLLELGMNVRRVASMVEETQADAWVVLGGSRDVLEWFASRPTPAFALFGRRRDLMIAGAGPHKPPALSALTKRLIELGHERIVMMVRAERRLPQPGATERAFLETLQRHGLSPSPYNLPDWEEKVDGFHHCLEELFRLTPPTALILDEAPFFMAAMQFCSQRGLKAPERISLACCDPDPNFFWCKPAITHIGWDAAPVIQRVLRWAANVSRGKQDRRQIETKATFFEGGTIGPVCRP